MAGIGNKTLQKHTAVREIGLRQALHGIERGAQVIGIAAHLHANAAAARAALEHDGKANGVRLRQGAVQIGQQAGAGQQGHTRLQRQRTGRVLEAKSAHLLRCRPHEGQPGGLAGLDKLRVFRQKAVAGVNRLRAAGQRRVNDALHGQIAARHSGSADTHGLVRHGHMGRLGIGL